MAEILEKAQTATLSASKSEVAELQRRIDRLTIEFHNSRDPGVLERATRLARQKERLLKPLSMRIRNVN